ncbi:SDR family NAD(P)-dependent oxidoreductase [Parahaliea mediterranea]|uniref:SDR family oxidoreductase n=1 Tax=Parahaliea mediterranea TaxID=651086 RepID=A0A939DFQ7_9GAMM|nr:SDR family oxidoreductase [Parahaliea mediterranea]MBN7796702.1 SDR family oxidoreductase [Parahaliea mediterranea]
MLLKDRIALVTGAGQGVGQGIALALAAEGARVAVTGRTLEKLEATCARIRERGGDALPLVCDVKSAESLAATVDATVGHFGGLNILVNNAQEVPLGTLLEVDDEAFTRGWESGPLATHRLMKLCYPHLKGNGVIVNLASSAGKRWDMSGYGAYAATKEAIRSLTRAAACEWGPEGIRTNVILPHAMSPGLAWWTENNPEEAEAFIASIPQRRIGDCERDIGRQVAALCSDYSAYVNGQSIGLDGGQAYLG